MPKTGCLYSYSGAMVAQHGICTDVAVARAFYNRAEAPVHRGNEETGAMRILIAEDDQILADGLLRSLRAAGYAVDHVGNGSEADAALAAHEFDMLPIRSSSGSRGWTSGPTTTWPSRSRCRNSKRACGR
jgi:hypothetical protein